MTPPLEKWLAEVEDHLRHANAPMSFHFSSITKGKEQSWCLEQVPLLVKLLRCAIEQRDIYIDSNPEPEIKPSTEKAIMNQELTQIISDTLGEK
jgi:hypothetical protein